MTLVDEGELDRLKQNQIKDYNPTVKSMVDIQNQINQIFEQPQLTDEDKFKLLSHLQNKFSYLYSKFKSSTITPAPAGYAAEPSEQRSISSAQTDLLSEEEYEDPANLTLMFQEIPTAQDLNLPHYYHKKYNMFRSFLEAHKHEITANDDNVISINGRVIAHSNFSDCLRSFYFRDPELNLIGLPELVKKLSKLNVNPDMFTDKQSINAIVTLEKMNSPQRFQTGHGGKNLLNVIYVQSLPLLKSLLVKSLNFSESIAFN